ncbi:MAG: extracellular solute-binding protein, partial [Chloroflexales bacterium]|nr:extracellular solute-binding protein [Chloroflexales bacterium]
NQEFWEQAGLAPPALTWTWDDLLAAATQAAQQQKDGITAYGWLDERGEANAAILAVFQAAGIDLLASAPDSPRLDQPAAATALERVVELVERRAIYLHSGALGEAAEEMAAPNFALLRDLVRSGQVAMWPASLVADMQLPFSIGVALLPPSGLPTFANTAHYVMSAGTQHPDAAWRWLSFVSRQAINALPPSDLQSAQIIPARRSLTAHEGYWAAFEASTEIAGISTIVQNALELPAPPAVADQRAVRAVAATLQSVLHDKQTASQALVDAQAVLEQQRSEQASAPPPTPDVAVSVATPLPELVPAGATVITFRYQHESVIADQMAILRRLADTFEQDHPGIIVRLKPYDVFAGDTLRSIAATADCFTWNGYLNGETLAATALDLQPLIDADPAFDLSDYPA